MLKIHFLALGSIELGCQMRFVSLFAELVRNQKL